MAGHRAAKRHSARRTQRARHARFLPSFTTLIGAAALVVAGAGAVTIGSGSVTTAVASGPIDRLAGQASSLSGTGDITSSNPERAATLKASRSSSRGAAATPEQLQAMAASKAASHDAALKQLDAQADSYADYVAKNAWLLPLPKGQYRITGLFGQCTTLWSHCHSGLDMAMPSGTPIRAIAAGTILYAQYDGKCGNRTVERLNDGTELWYCHQSKFGVKPGDVVKAGDLIGYVGSTGHTTGPHLHVEVHPGGGDAVDPLKAMVAHGLDPWATAANADAQGKKSSDPTDATDSTDN